MGLIEKEKAIKPNRLKKLIVFVYLLCMQFIMIEYSMRSLREIFNNTDDIRYMFVGLLTILFIDMTFLLIFNNMIAAFTLGSLVLVILSITNHFTNLYHGTPFIFEDLKNFNTAMNVLHNYSLSVDRITVLILLLFILVVFMAVVMYRGVRLKRRYFVLPYVLLIVLGYFCYFFCDSFVPKYPVEWSWTEACIRYGYLPTLVEQSISVMNPVQEPENYDEEATEKLVKSFTTQKASTSDYPDIILILNETFYDLDQVIDTGTQGEVLSYVNSLKNGIYGYTISPDIGGGTNDSEYEILTSNSARLIPSGTPFTSLNMQNANSVVSYLKSLGYNTFGTHPYVPDNYNRNVAYPQLGFDKITWLQDYEDPLYYANRTIFLEDECVYKNLNQWYEEEIQTNPDSPLFMYCLTIQNHGDWISNDESDAIVKTSKDFGEYTGDINEFLSCIKLSDDAFKLLVDYYKKADRDVIIVMTGDHSPSFAEDASEEYGISMSKNERNLKLTSTPFVIWSNNQKYIDQSLDGQTFSKIYLLPTVLKMAGLPLNGYYCDMMSLKSNVPILSKNGYYYDSDNNRYTYDQNTKYTDEINEYFSLEYLNITKPELFADK